MTTATTSTRVRHDSDATFREWGSENQAQLAACGLVQTSDTGQVNWTTVTRPGANTNAGFEIWRFNDSLQGTAPIYLRFDYGTHGTATGPRMMVTVGTGTNGSGTLTGTALTTSRVIMASLASGTDTVRNSYWCHAEGFFGMWWKRDAQDALFAVSRSCDNTGTPTVTAGIVVWGSGTAANLTATQGLRFAASAAAYTAQTSQANCALGLNPQCPASTLVGTDTQTAVGWMITPQVSPIFSLCGVVDAEVADGNEFDLALVGSTSRHYKALSDIAGAFGPINASSTGGLKFAMLWE